MNRRNLAFLVAVNAVVSLVIAVTVVWLFEARRPDPEELAALNTPRPLPVLAATPTPPASAGEPGVTPAGEGASPGTGGTPEPTVESTEEAEPVEEIYIVQPGDSLLAIATRFDVTVDDIVRANNLPNPDFVFSGQRLVIPTGGVPPEAGGDAGSGPTATPIVEGIVISGIEAAGDLANETAIVVNQSSIAISLQGWRLEREGGPAYTFGNVPLFPGAGVRVHSTAGSDNSIDLYWGQSAAVWTPGAVARLLNPQGDVVSTLTAQ